ncbi:MAG: type III pantothenate kinase [Alistipes sp.]|nr:type III pantothenate kinase [Alistipes sp.]
MKLIVDIGNSRAKVVVMRGSEVVKSLTTESLAKADIEALVGQYPALRRAIVASTRGDGDRVTEVVRSAGIEALHFNPATTPIPLENRYLTPATLGPDRLAAAVGASALYPNRDVMIVDFGTAITIDYVVGGAFVGGNISPGVTTRFRALADYTARLPLCSATEQVLEYGRTTQEAIEQGVMRGVEQEIKGYVESFLAKNCENCTIFTGGDAKYFVKRIKNAIFADCEPVVYGLSTILEYNAEKF